MTAEKRLPLALLMLRLSVFLVLLLWTLDKFINPGHAAKVFDNFYFLSGLGPVVLYVIGALETLLILAFLVGLKKRFSYGLVFVIHAISTLSSYEQYLEPYDGPNLLFFAAWPMLAACWTLYLLRDRDTLFVMDAKKGRP